METIIENRDVEEHGKNMLPYRRDISRWIPSPSPSLLSLEVTRDASPSSSLATATSMKAFAIPPRREHLQRCRKKKTLLVTLEPRRKKKRKRGRRDWRYLLLHRKPEKKKERRRSTYATKDPRSPPRATIEGENTLKSPLSLLEMQNVLAPKIGWFARRKKGEDGCSLTRTEKRMGKSFPLCNPKARVRIEIREARDPKVRYARGVVTLIHMYEQLEDANFVVTKQMIGYLTLLQEEGVCCLLMIKTTLCRTVGDKEIGPSCAHMSNIEPLVNFWPSICFLAGSKLANIVTIYGCLLPFLNQVITHVRPTSSPSDYVEGYF
ncbi:hypothetical protein V8G54_018465 [Vigna mungo]|uniref:Uncharacterized protein n=1 Tax=Vigna mungo TaxID=3915 RepID=A0AAQ3RUM7_VIGMU